MGWGWAGRGPSSVEQGGSVGSASEASVAHAWKRYERDYLKEALESGKYNTDGLDDVQRAAYLKEVVKGYKGEADERLKGEFEQWLKGQHAANDQEGENVYENAPDKPVRRWVFRDKDAEVGDGG